MDKGTRALWALAMWALLAWIAKWNPDSFYVWRSVLAVVASGGLIEYYITDQLLMIVRRMRKCLVELRRIRRILSIHAKIAMPIPVLSAAENDVEREDEDYSSDHDSGYDSDRRTSTTTSARNRVFPRSYPTYSPPSKQQQDDIDRLRHRDGCKCYTCYPLLTKPLV